MADIYFISLITMQVYFNYFKNIVLSIILFFCLESIVGQKITGKILNGIEGTTINFHIQLG